ncbi:type VI secretion system-associated protein TagF [Pseudomonas putida]|uniref:type VI secretion system-associated protein TagF n=1 Tax=Pseudomonas putida TaxID=303 RepID=UPI00236472F2|nr:type VI secretion system-associated protein TagF [Pseudomonas putida]MDD1969153.1 type VI secretion system-associated protein TagF [Pseudomonas putida]
MSSTDLTLPVCYFGKLPSQGDFLKGGENRPLLALLDQWVTTGLEALTEDVAWKSLYDSARPVDFAFMGSRNRSVIGGRLVPSEDASGRRFPFMAAVTFEVDHPLGFVARCPQSLSRLWSRLGRELTAAKAASDPTSVLAELISEPIELTTNPDVLQATFVDFLEAQTVGSLQSLLNASGHQVDVRRVLIGLGTLMKPVRESDAPKMGKGLQLPLPVDPMYRPLVATFWLDLISGFLDRANLDLMLLQRIEPVPILTLGFQGISARGVYGVFDPRSEAQDTVLLDDPDWIEDQIHGNYALKKMSSYTSQNGLSLKTARSSFLETFLGA